MAETPQQRSAAEPGATGSRRIAKRYAFPVAAVLLLIMLGSALGIRGTWAEAVVRNPASSAEGVVTQLYQPAGEAKRVRCSRMVDAPIAQVWAVVTDYRHFDELFPGVSEMRVDAAEPARPRLEYLFSAFGMRWEVAVTVQHQTGIERCVASWDESSPDVELNRGGWTLERIDDARTLLVYELEARTAACPDFLVRAILMSVLEPIVSAVADRLER